MPHSKQRYRGGGDLLLSGFKKLTLVIDNFQLNKKFIISEIEKPVFFSFSFESYVLHTCHSKVLI